MRCGPINTGQIVGMWADRLFLLGENGLAELGHNQAVVGCAGCSKSGHPIGRTRHDSTDGMARLKIRRSLPAAAAGSIIPDTDRRGTEQCSAERAGIAVRRWMDVPACVVCSLAVQMHSCTRQAMQCTTAQGRQPQVR